MYQNAAILAAFLLIYSAVAVRVERSWISGPIVFTGIGFILGPDAMVLFPTPPTRISASSGATSCSGEVAARSWIGARSVLLRRFRRRADRCGNGHARGSSFYGTGQGCAFQISAAYWAIVRSLENFPELATFRIALRAHPSPSA
jgi:hypothetical protein